MKNRFLKKLFYYLDTLPGSCLTTSSNDRDCRFSSTELTLHDRNIRLEEVGFDGFSTSDSCSRKGGRWAYSESSSSSFIVISEFLETILEYRVIYVIIKYLMSMNFTYSIISSLTGNVCSASIAEDLKALYCSFSFLYSKIVGNVKSK